MIPSEGFNLDNRNELRLSSSQCGRHDEVDSGSIGVMKGAGVVFAKPGVLEGVRAVDFMGLGEEEPKVVEGLPRDKLKLRKSVLIDSRSCEVGDEGIDRCLG
jgi:hypothetical protein